ncbi:MAG TPA: DUF2505 family protein [Labilithrix sp.]|nr:DUF2505 family protein [Labilithrix sp.]
MHFEVVHEFDIPLDALELAVISPNLFQELSKRLHGIESVSQKEHILTDSRLERLWSYRASVKIPAFATRYVTPEMCAWDEKSTYDIKRHSSEWTILPHVKPEWRKLFTAKGTYVLEQLESGRTRRIVNGILELRVPLVRPVAEKLIMGEVRKTFDAEAETLRELATLV